MTENDNDRISDEVSVERTSVFRAEFLNELDAPAHGIAPGQAAVVYDGDLVVGASTIATTAR